MRLRALMNRDTVYQNLMFLFCVLFGLAMIANVQPAGDGVWFWYSWFFLGGKHLYADMHLALQPLFVLETASVIVQVASFKMTGKRVFRMAPLHHHYEKKGWAEPTIVIRFWIIAAILALVGLSSLKLR